MEDAEITMLEYRILEQASISEELSADHVLSSTRFSSCLPPQRSGHTVKTTIGKNFTVNSELATLTRGNDLTWIGRFGLL